VALDRPAHRLPQPLAVESTGDLDRALRDENGGLRGTLHPPEVLLLRGEAESLETLHSCFSSL
jgi:hypothetical protein